jgi:acyl phosphate:glycerol-3-phosphate acyltransferase
MAATALITLLSSYLIGSIPFGYLAGRLAGIDVRQHGSGNIGATNVLRVLGKKWGLPVFFLDALKGFAAVQVALFFSGRSADTAPYADVFGILAAAVCVAGHSFPVWLKFNGGKGVATSAGALVALVPLATLTIFIVWVVVFFSTRYVSLASVCAALTLPLAVAALIYLGRIEGVVLLWFTSAMTALVVWRHRSNLSRLLAGTEPRFSRK